MMRRTLMEHKAQKIRRATMLFCTIARKNRIGFLQLVLAKSRAKTGFHSPYDDLESSNWTISDELVHSRTDTLNSLATAITVAVFPQPEGPVRRQSREATALVGSKAAVSHARTSLTFFAFTASSEAEEGGNRSIHGSELRSTFLDGGKGCLNPSKTTFESDVPMFGEVLERVNGRFFPLPRATVEEALLGTATSLNAERFHFDMAHSVRQSQQNKVILFQVLTRRMY
jgi:hypothetical protein